MKKLFLPLFYIVIPIFSLLVWFGSIMLLAIFETKIVMYSLSMLAVIFLILVYTSFLTRKLRKLYTGFDRVSALIYLWIFSSLLIFLHLLNPFFSHLARYW